MDRTPEEALSGAVGPAILLLGAGDINIGAYDRFRELIPIARAQGAWVHVDGAFGLWANASPSPRLGQSPFTPRCAFPGSWAPGAAPPRTG